MFDFSHLSNSLAGRGLADVPCPECGPRCSTPRNATRRVLRLWWLAETAISYKCARCDASGFVTDHHARDLTAAERKAMEARFAAHRAKAAAEAERKRHTVEWLWKASVPVIGTLGETYFRKHRGITCKLPPGMRFIGAGKHPAAILMPFHDAQGRLTGLHLTTLNPDGSKIEKKMLGPSAGCPLVCTEPFGSHLGVTEGIEDALSLHQAVGIAMWAAGSAGRLPPLAGRLPDWVTELTIVADADVPGQAGAAELRRRAMNGRRDIVILSLAEA